MKRFIWIKLLLPPGGCQCRPGSRAGRNQIIFKSRGDAESLAALAFSDDQEVKVIRSKPQQKVSWSHVDLIWPVYTLKSSFSQRPELQWMFFYLKSFWTEGETVVGNNCASLMFNSHNENQTLKNTKYHQGFLSGFWSKRLTGHQTKLTYTYIFSKILIVLNWMTDIFWHVRSEILSWCNSLFFISIKKLFP